MGDDLGWRLRVLRVKARLSQKGLASQVGMSESRLCALERSRYPVERLKGLVLMRFAEALGCSTDYLLGRTDKETPCPTHE